MINTDINVQFPQPDYAVVFFGDAAVKSLTAADFGGDRAMLKLAAMQYANGLVEGFSQARSILGNCIPSVRTR